MKQQNTQCMARASDLRPTGTHILVLPAKDDETHPSGLTLPKSITMGKKLTQGIIHQKGEGNQYNDMYDIIPGNRIYFRPGSGTLQELEDVEYLILDYSECLFVES